ncbi:MAG TPA: hypothetical protein HA254_03765 [Candidatus Diapherotrites archaeon]|uniref:Ribosome-associated translation inhibitor RaiA n=1 Tax=Candidatus Iainarchaeum sp. TaxID=3101447 RepID=A0A7J4IWB2_9ARCH|nr:hypothetical protein [Candidatus Diapherotrites archaeon]
MSISAGFYNTKPLLYPGICIERKINISGMPQGHGIDISQLTSQIEKFYDKLTSRLGGGISLGVHFREFHKQGKREQVETKTSLNTAGIALHASAKEWEAENSLKSALNALEKEAEKVILRKKGK